MPGQCPEALTGHTDSARRRRPVEPRVDCSSTPRGAQVECVAALSNGNVVSGSWDFTLKVWDVSRGRCRRTLTRHTSGARRRRPKEQRIEPSSTGKTSKKLPFRIQKWRPRASRGSSDEPVRAPKRLSRSKRCARSASRASENFFAGSNERLRARKAPQSLRRVRGPTIFLASDTIQHIQMQMPLSL